MAWLAPMAMTIAIFIVPSGDGWLFVLKLAWAYALGILLAKIQHWYDEQVIDEFLLGFKEWAETHKP